MATNHYKGQANRLSENDLPEDVQEELSSTFSPDVIYALLRDAYYRGPVRVGEGGERRVYGGGKPGTGLRRPDGPFYNYPEAWRNSVLRKAVVLDLVQVLPTDADVLDASENRYVVTDRGLNVLLDGDRCSDCGRVNRPRLRNAGSSRKLTRLTTACPVHDSKGTDYERDEEKVENARATVEDMEGVHVYLNDDSELRARDPDGLRSELRYGDRVELDDSATRREGVEGVVVEPEDGTLSDTKAMGPVNDYTASENEVVVLVLNDEGVPAGKKTLDRTALRLVEENYVEEVPVFTEGAKVKTHGGGVSREVVRVEGDYYEVRYPSSNPYSEGEESSAVYHALELEPATRALNQPEPEFEEGDEVRHLPARDRDKDFKLGVPCEVARVVEEDYDEEKGYYYVLNYAGTDEYYLGTYGRGLLPEEDARERDPDEDPLQEGDRVRVEDEEGVWVVYDRPTPNVEGNYYSYRLVPEGTATKSNRGRRSGVIRNDLYARGTRLQPVEDDADEE